MALSTAELNAIMARLPLTPSPELQQYARRAGYLDQRHVTVYRADAYQHPLSGEIVKCASITCSACKEIYMVERSDVYVETCRSDSPKFGIWDAENGRAVWPDGDYTCPNCGQETTLMHVSGISRYGTRVDDSVIAEFIKIDGLPVFVSYLFRRTVFKSGKPSELFTPFEAYLFAGKRCYKFYGWYKYFTTYVYMDHWELQAKCTDTIALMTSGRILPVSDNYFAGTIFENAKIERFLRESDPNKCFPITYLRTYQQHHQIENFVTIGLSKFVNELIYANSASSYHLIGVIPKTGITWKKKKPFEMLGFRSRDEMKAMIAERWTIDELELYRLAVQNGIRFSIQRYREDYGFPHYGITRDLLKFGADPYRVRDYLKKQNAKGVDASVSYYIDYCLMAKKTGTELRNSADKYPPNLKNAHDALTQLYNQEQIEREAKKAKNKIPAFRKLAKQYAGYTFADGDLLIRIAESPRELIAEGKALHHCVGTYVNKHAGGKSCIFLIRQVSAPDASYYTLELNMNTLNVIQNRGYTNCARTPEVEAFENKWLDYIKNLQIRKGA